MLPDENEDKTQESRQPGMKSREGWLLFACNVSLSDTQYLAGVNFVYKIFSYL